MVQINGDYGKNPKIGQGFGINNVNHTQQTESKPAVDNKPKGEYGNKLLDQVQPQFVTIARLLEADAVQLREMYKAAGVPERFMPTQAVYNRVSENTNSIAKQIDDIGTKANVEHLYTTETFQKLNNLFGIE